MLYDDQIGYEKRGTSRDALEVDKASQPHMFMSQFMQGDGYDHVVYSSASNITNLLSTTQVRDLELECMYPAKSPAIGVVLGDGVKKNTMATVGLVCKHNMLVTIGDSPGPHYNNYQHMRGCLLYTSDAADE